MRPFLTFGSALLGLIFATGLFWAIEVSWINRAARAVLDRAGHREYVTQISFDGRCKFGNWTVYFISMHSPVDRDYKGYLCISRFRDSSLSIDDNIPFDIDV